MEGQRKHVLVCARGARALLFSYRFVHSRQQHGPRIGVGTCREMGTETRCTPPHSERYLFAATFVFKYPTRSGCFSNWCGDKTVLLFFLNSNDSDCANMYPPLPPGRYALLARAHFCKRLIVCMRCRQNQFSAATLLCSPLAIPEPLPPKSTGR